MLCKDDDDLRPSACSYAVWWVFSSLVPFSLSVPTACSTRPTCWPGKKKQAVHIQITLSDETNSNQNDSHTDILYTPFWLMNAPYPANHHLLKKTNRIKEIWFFFSANKFYKQIFPFGDIKMETIVRNYNQEELRPKKLKLHLWRPSFSLELPIRDSYHCLKARLHGFDMVAFRNQSLQAGA